MMEIVAQIVVIPDRKRHSVLQKRLEILYQAQISANLVDIGAETHLANELFAHLADTQGVKTLSYSLETNFIFKFCRINHFL